MAGDHIELDGEVIDVKKGKFVVKHTEEMTILAQLSGKMRKNKIRVNLGDTVTVKVSPYDITHGFIVYRK